MEARKGDLGARESAESAAGLVADGEGAPRCRLISEGRADRHPRCRFGCVVLKAASARPGYGEVRSHVVVCAVARVCGRRGRGCARARCRVKAMELALKDGGSTDLQYRTMPANENNTVHVHDNSELQSRSE